ncbi:MAG TPA: DUF1476 domain-containing protein [Roseiarcus sp.]|jgi:hypothetical protein
MSDEFDRREDGFEKRFVMSEELRFKALARRNKTLGLWAAERLGRKGEAARAYADALVAAQVGRGDDDVAAALAHDFAAAGLDISAHRIGRKMAEAMAEAVAEIEAGR